MKKLFLAAFCIFFVSVAYGRKDEVLRMSVLGDSYSTFEGFVNPNTNYVWYLKEPSNRNDVCQVEQTWWWQVKENMGWTIERLNSYSGSTICCTGYDGKDYTENAFITRMTNLGEADIILVCGGTNDSWANSPLGTYKYGDWTKEELFSFRPAMAKLCHGLRTHYPRARILFLLNSELKDEIDESIITICDHYDIPVLSLQRVDKQKNHPSIAGMKSISEQVTEWIVKNWKINRNR